jgi:ABC-type antimicrobial peptide transport system permease subunit
LHSRWALPPVLFEIRYSARKFARAPGLALALLVTIALGIGSNVSVYGFIRGLTKSSNPLTSAGGVVSIFRQDAHRAAGPLSYQEYLSLKRDPSAFEWIGGARISPSTIATAGQSAIGSVAAVTSNLAGVLSLSLENGVVISHRMWQSEFGAKANVRGEQIRINGVNARVSGVAPDWLEGLYRDRAVDLWMPLLKTGLQKVDSSSRNFWVLARLRSGVSASQAQTGEIIVLPYMGMTPEMAEGLSRIGTLLGLGAGVVFFITCANVFSFLLGRAFARSHETSLRVALGAGRSQLARELFWDSVVISVSGGALGLLLAVWTAHVVPALLFEEDAGRLVFAPDLFSIVTASIALAGITIVCGLMPVFLTSDDRPAIVLRQESTGPSKAMARLRSGLIVAQMASCCVLVISTAFLFDALRVALRPSVGQRPSDLVLITVQAQPATGIRYFQQVEQAVRSIAGVSGMAWTGKVPGSQPAWQSFRIEPEHLPLREIPLDIDWFTARSLNLFTLPPSAGRLFGYGDQACQVTIVNEAAAAELFDRNTVGRAIQDAAGLPVEIIGVVAEKGSHARKASRPTIYYNHTDQNGPAPDRAASAHVRAPVRSELVSAELDANVVSPGYFSAMGLPLIAGRVFTDHPMSGECRVGVVNQEAADLYFGGNAVGAAVIDEQGVRTAIVGVVRSKLFGIFQRRAEPAIYFPMSQDALSRMTLIASARKVSGPILADLRRWIESVPGRGPAPVMIETFATHLSHTALAPLRIASMIIGASATTAILLSILGLFGALSDAARRRRRELAIRIALGAQRWRIIYHVLREGGRLACAGTLLGMFGSLALWRWLARITPGNNSPALWVWLAAPFVLAVAVLLASVLPARGALLVNPLTIMRDDN